MGIIVDANYKLKGPSGVEGIEESGLRLLGMSIRTQPALKKIGDTSKRPGLQLTDGAEN